MPKQGPQLLKVWEDWSGGVGHLRDDGETPGMYTASAVLGLHTELRPAPLKQTTARAITPKSHYMYFFEEPATAAPTETYLYGVRNQNVSTAAEIDKFDLRNAGFGAFIAVSGETIDVPLGQPARYEGVWCICGGTTTDASNFLLELTTVSTPAVADAWNVTDPSFAGKHLILLNFQLATVGKEVRILTEDGNPLTNADWGPNFPAGDTKTMALGMAGLEGSIYLLKKEGVYAFGTKARSRLAFEDLKSWTNIFREANPVPWQGGLVFPHPSGLLYVRPGERPENIGVDARPGMRGSPPPGPTELHGGRYHGIYGIGDYLWVIYQPVPSATTALVMVLTAGAGWQVVAELTMDDVDLMAGIGVSTQGYPESATSPSPTLFFADLDDLSYMFLDNRASPFRARAETHKVALSGDAYMSELFFPQPVNLSHFVVTAQDMASEDEWQLSVIANAGNDVNAGAPVQGSGQFTVPFTREGVHRLMAHVGWTATSTAARVAPCIKRIELWGWLS